MQLNKQRIAQTFAEFVAIDSPSYRERRMADHLTALYAGMGVSLSEDGCAADFGGDAGNLFGRLPGSLPGAPLLFSAHMDTVEPSCGKRAVFHPDGRITSAGDTVLGADDAGGLTAIYEAVRWLKETNTPHRSLELMFSPAEEHFSEGTRRFDFTRSEAEMGYVLDLSAEMGAAALKAPGSVHFWLTVHGKAAHSGFNPEDGVHAIAIAADALTKLKFGAVDPITTVNIGVIHGGRMTNIIPERCELEGEIRSYEDGRIQQELDKILRVFDEAAKKQGGSVTSRHEWCYKALDTPQDAKIVSCYRRACEAVGLPCKLTGTFGMSDCNHLPANGIEGIVVSSAMWNCHSTGEYTTLDDLVRLTGLVIELMRQPQE